MNNTIIPHFFFIIRILVILGKRRNFLVVFILTPTHFSAENRKTTKTIPANYPTYLKFSPKFLVDVAQKLTQKTPKLDPPYRPYRGGGVILKSYLNTVFYWACVCILETYFKNKLFFFRTINLYYKKRWVFVILIWCLLRVFERKFKLKLFSTSPYKDVLKHQTI